MLAACGGGGDSTATTSAKGTLSVKLTDAPASAYEQVVVTINEVRVHRSDTAEEGDGGWESLDVGEGVLPLQVDLLDLRNGVLASLGDIELEAGQYSQIRLVLAENPRNGNGQLANYVVVRVDETTTETHPLTTPSAQQSGVKLIHPFEVPDGKTIELVLDFDAARSVVEAGKGSASVKYLLKPTIAVIATVVGEEVVNAEFGGAFAGDDIARADGASVSLQSVEPDGTVTVVRAGVVEADGTWNLTPVPAGTGYNLVVTKPGFRTAVVTGIDLAEGDVVAVPSFPLVALGADATEIAANTALVDGTVDSAAAVTVQALNKLDGGNAVEIAFATVAEGEGAFAMSLPALAPMVAPYVPGEAPAFSPMGEPALHDFVAVGTIATAAVAGATTEVTLTGGDATNVVDIPLAEI
ncbi:MAG: DUF4382 domain-containing protein [Alphaproteobacteria bacterium]